MSINAENMFNEIQDAGGYYSAKPITTTATGTFATLSNTGAMAVGGALTVAGAATVTGLTTLNGGLTVTGATILPAIIGIDTAGVKTGALTGNVNPTGTTGGIGTLFLNTGSGATGVTNRIYINTNGATGWTYVQTGA